MTKRQIHTKIWTDDGFAVLSKNAKILFLYCLTNSRIGLSGMFECSDRVICFESGLTQKELLEAKEELQKSVLFFEGWVFVKKGKEYNPINGETNPLQVALQKEVENVPKDVLQYFTSSPQVLEAPSKPLGRGIDAPLVIEKNSNRNEESVRETKSSVSYLQNLPQSDIDEFCARFDISESRLKSKAEELLNYTKMYRKKYADYKAFLLNALKRDFKPRTIKAEIPKEPEHFTPIDPKRIEELRKQAHQIVGHTVTGKAI
jgi:hypothetical protein